MDTTRIALIKERLRITQTKAHLFLHDSISDDGRVFGGCEGRPLETTLAIHLARDFPGADVSALVGHMDRMVSFCERFWEDNGVWVPSDSQADLDSGLSNAFVSSVLDLSPLSGV